MIYLIGAYVFGYIFVVTNPSILSYLVLSPYHVLHGQIWRLVTWIFMPVSGNILSLLIMSLLYYQLGRTLESNWGTFRFNVYIIGGMLCNVIGAFLLYGFYYIVGGSTLAFMHTSTIAYGMSLQYINMSIFLAFAVMYPEMQIMLYFIIPIKMKWMAVVYGVITVYQFIANGWAGRISIFMSLLNFIIFFMSTRNLKRYTPHEVHRRQKFKAQMREPRQRAGVTKHKCAICGRTELDSPNLEFRFCSKCEGNYEYCSEHLFTHQHIRRS